VRRQGQVGCVIDVGRLMARCQTRIMLLTFLVQMDMNQVMAREEPCEVVVVDSLWPHRRGRGGRRSFHAGRRPR